MKLRFYARRGHVVRGTDPVYVGSMIRAVGRGSAKTPQGIALPPLQEPVEIDSDSKLGMKLLRRFAQTPSNPPMVPADAATATACGIPYVPARLGRDGEYDMSTVEEASLSAGEVDAQ